MTSYLLEATVNDFISDFFLQLIYSLWLIARKFYYITIDRTVKLNDQETVKNPVFDKVNVSLSDTAHHNMEQKYVFSKNTNFRCAFDVNIVRHLYFLKYP